MKRSLLQRFGVSVRSLYLLIAVVFIAGVDTVAQTTINTTHINNNGNGLILFVVRNNNSYPIRVSAVTCMTGTSANNAMEVLYHPGELFDNSAPWGFGTVGSGQNGWISAKTETASTTTNNYYTISGLQIIIPAGESYHMAFSAVTIQYMTLSSGVNTFSADGVDLVTGDGVSWGGTQAPATPANYPRGLIGGITCGPAIPADVELSGVGQFSEYTQIPLAQVTGFSLTGTATNNSSGDVNSVVITATINHETNGHFATLSGSLSSLAANASSTVSIGTFLPTEPGKYYINYAVSHGGYDTIPENNAAIDSIIITEDIYARDNGDIVGGLGIGAGNGGYIGQTFHVENADVLTAVTLGFSAGYTGERAAASVWSTLNGEPVSLIGVTDTLHYASNGAAILTFPMNGGNLYLPPGDYVVAAIEFDSTIQLAQTSQKFTEGTVWVDWPTSPFSGWANVEQFGSNFAKSFYIRLSLGQSTSVAVSDVGTAFCAGDTATVSITQSGIFDPNNSFEAYLSDANGSFSSETLIGSVTGATASGIGFTIPANTPAGEFYRIRVKSTNPASISDDNGSDIIVSSAPAVTLDPLPSICENSGPLVLSGGAPSGGTYSGPGVSNGSFDPSATGIGTRTITYVLTTSEGCSGSASTQIVVNNVPTVSLPNFAAVCVNAPAFVLKSGMPAAGTYTVDGNSETEFNPAYYGVGSHTIVFSYTRPSTGCSNSISKSIEVKAEPEIVFDFQNSVCIDAQSLTLTATPAGGTFSGDGVTGDSFDAASAGAGNHNLFYTYTAPNGCLGVDSQVVVVNELPEVTLAAFDGICRSETSLALSGGLPAGGDYSGDAVNGGSFYTAGVIGTSDVTYIYTDENGCSNSATQSIEVFDGESITMPADFSLCLNDAALTLSGQSPQGGTFSGNGVSDYTFDPAVAGVGVHTITYNFESEVGCPSVAAFNITVKALPSASIGSNGLSACAGGSVTLSLGTFDSYQWYKDASLINGESGSSLATGLAGEYTAKITSNGCSALTDAVTVVINTLPEPGIQTPQYPSFCQNASVALSTGNYSSYTWKLNGDEISNSNASIYNASVAGNYTVTVTDSNGCIGTSLAVAISGSTPVVVSSNRSLDLCIGESVILSSSNAASYQWFKDGDELEGETFKDLSTSEAGGYYVIAKDNTGCTATSATVVVNKFSSLPAPVVSIQGAAEFCKGGTTVLTSTEDFSSYQWFRNGSKINGAEFKTLSNELAGDFTLFVTDENGCPGTSSVVSVVVNSAPSVALNVPSINHLCAPGTLEMSVVAANGANYQWFKNGAAILNAQTNSYTATETGLYKLIAESAEGCVDSSTMVLVNIKAQPAQPVVSLVAVNTLESSAASGNQWYKDGEMIQGATAKILVVSANGTYTVRVSNAGGCSNESEAYNLIDLSVSDVTNAGFSIAAYPNPFNDRITISLTENAKYQLFDIQGRIFAAGDLEKGVSTIELSGLAKGSYQLRAIGSLHSTVIQLIKE